MGEQWYVMHTYSGYENKVKDNLQQRIKSMKMEDKIFEILLPTEEIVEMKNGEKKTSTKKIFPGYLLIKMEMTDDSWHVIKNTPGVTDFVGAGGKPIPLTKEEVENIINQMRVLKEKPKPKVMFEEGENVRIVDGPFTNFTGKVEEVNLAKGKMKVLVVIFGRATPVELDFLQVGKL